MAEKSSFIISDGGIGGLAMALVLAQDGYRVTALEQAAAFREMGAGTQRACGETFAINVALRAPALPV